jgi:glucokinase
MGTLRLGLDIGGTKIAAMVVDGDLRPLAEGRWPTVATDADAFGRTVVEISADLLQQAGAQPADLAAIGVGIPGQVNPQTGRVHQAVNLNLDDYPLRDTLQKQFACPVRIENDVAAAAIGAYHHLRQQTPRLRHLAYIGIGTGIAAGLILNGRLYRGARGMAGEIGHIIVEPGGARCNCGAHGCLETIVAGPAIARQAAGFLPGAHAGAVYAAAHRGMPQAQQLVRRVSNTLAQAIHWLVMSCDVEKIVLGGGVAAAGPLFLDPVTEALAQLRDLSPLNRMMLSGDSVALLPPTYKPGLWGAVYLAEQALLYPDVFLEETLQ